MSKFIKSIQVYEPHERKAIIPRLSIEMTINPDTEIRSPDYVEKILFVVRWNLQAFCKLPEEEIFLLSNAMRQLREDVYGEFRQQAMELQRAIYERDFMRAETILNEILREMYS